MNPDRTKNLRLARLAVIWTCATIVSVIISGKVSADDKKKQSFEVTIAGKTRQTFLGVVQNIAMDMTLRYSYVRRDRKETLFIDSVASKVSLDGKRKVDFYLSGRKFINGVGSARTEVALKDALAPLKKILADGFGPPICQFDLDENGQVIKRRVVALPGAKYLVDKGVIENARLFHVMFLEDQKKWQAKNEISIGNGSFARGKLTYQKMEATDAGVVRVKVTGTLINLSHKAGKVELKDAKYEISGEQIYDLAARQWRSGKLDIKVSYGLALNGNPSGAARGSMLVTMRTVIPVPAAPATSGKDSPDKPEDKK